MYLLAILMDLDAVTIEFALNDNFFPMKLYNKRYRRFDQILVKNILFIEKLLHKKVTENTFFHALAALATLKAS